MGEPVKKEMGFMETGQLRLSDASPRFSANYVFRTLALKVIGFEY